MAKELKFYLTAKQSQAYKLLTNDDDCAIMYGGAKGGGKSFFLCLAIDVLIERLIKLWNLKYDSSRAPIPVGFIGRKQSVDFRTTTLETFKRIIPADHYRIKTQDQEIIFSDMLKVYYGGLDDQDRIKKFNSAEFAFFAIDQAEETDRTDVDVLQASLRLTYDTIKPAYKQIYTANPAECWLKEDFIDNKKSGCHFIPALYTDNKYLPLGYGETLDSAFRYNEPLLRAYKYGDWYALQGTNNLISSLMLEELKGITRYPKHIHRIVVCDPSLGGDECVIYFMQNYEVKEQIILHERDTMKIGARMMTLGVARECPNYAVDCIGIGQGIVDHIKDTRPRDRVIAINSAESATDDNAYANVRAEIAWYTAKKIMNKEIPYPQDEELRRQLVNYKFKVVNSNGRTRLEPKEDMKKRIGRSPDRGDAFFMGVWAQDQTKPITKRDAWDDQSRCDEVHSGCGSAMAA